MTWAYLILIATLLAACLWSVRRVIRGAIVVDTYDCGDSERPTLPTREEP